jgi:hypothetical protein
METKIVRGLSPCCGGTSPKVFSRSKDVLVEREPCGPIAQHDQMAEKIKSASKLSAERRRSRSEQF